MKIYLESLSEWNFTVFMLNNNVAKIEDHKTASESMRTKHVWQEWDRNISLIIVIDSAVRCYIFSNIINTPEH